MKILNTSYYRAAALVCLSVQITFGQMATLALSSASVPRGGTVTLALSLTSASTAPAGLQWTLNYSPHDITAIWATIGPAAAAAEKSIHCAAHPGVYTCLETGVNANTLGNGVVAFVNLTTSSAASESTLITFTGTLGATLNADALAVNGTGAALTINRDADTVPPSVPAGLTATATSSSQISLAWSASTDNVAVTGYRIHRNGTQVGTATTTYYADSSLSPATTYSYSVTARDAAGNASTASAPASATTFAPPPVASSLSCSPSSLIPGATATCLVTLSAAAPTGGSTVTLSCDTAALTLPISVVAPAGSSLASFPVTSSSVPSDQTATIAATLEGATKTASIWLVSAANATPPQAVAVSPNTGSGSSQLFTFVASDSSGAAHLRQTEFRFTPAANPSGVCYGRFQASAGVYLMNDAQSGWLGPLALGTNNTLENSACGISGGNSSVLLAGDNQVLNLEFIFKSPMTGANSVQLAPTDAAGQAAPWAQVGTWTVPGANVANQPPIAISVSPNTGGGTSQTFSFVTSDPNGATDITRIHVLFSSPGGSCSVQWEAPNNLYLLGDTAGTAWQGPLTLGTAGTLDNKHCQIKASGATVQNGGTHKTLTVPMVFKPGLSGTVSVFLTAMDGPGATSPSPAVGTWTLPATNQPPQAISVWPDMGTGAASTFSFVTSDPNGATDITQTYILFSSFSLSRSGFCYAQWTAPDSLYLLNDAYTAWLGPVTLGTANTLENSFCRINGTGATVQFAGNSQTLTLPIAFKAPGTLSVYLSAADSTGASAPLKSVGTWTVP